MVSLSTSFKIMMGVPLLGSIIRALIFTSISINQHLWPGARARGQLCFESWVFSRRPKPKDPRPILLFTHQFTIKTVRLSLRNQHVDYLSGLCLPGPEVNYLVAS